MRVTLAYPQPEGGPDDTVTVDDERGRLLLQDGFARRVDNPSKADLEDYARLYGVDASGTKDVVAERIAARTDPTAGTTGTTGGSP